MKNKLILAILAAGLGLLAANRAHETRLQQAIDLMETKGDLPGAIRLFEEVSQSTDRNLAARALLYLGDCRRKQGAAESRKSYERVVREFGDQREVAAEAQARLAGLPSGAGSGIVTRQIWTGPKVDTSGAISPDGRSLLFVDWDGAGNVALRDLATGKERTLTEKKSWFDGDEYSEGAIFSPDGARVAYSWADSTNRYELRLMDVNTSGAKARRLFRNQDIQWLNPFDWSADGKWIAIALERNDHSAQIGLVNAGDGTLRVLKSMDWRGVTKLFFSPDGKYLAYDLPQSEDSDNRDVYLIATDGSRDTPVAAHPANDILLGWTPDGAHLLFASDRSGSMSAWAQPVSNGRAQGAPLIVKRDFGRPWSLGLTKAGSLFYGVMTGSRDFYLTSVDIKTGKALAPAVRPVQQYVGFNDFPNWSPDGKQLAYLSKREPLGFRYNILAIATLETGQVKEHRPKLTYMWALRWSPDGRAFAVNGTDAKGRQGVYRIDAQTGEVTPIAISRISGEYFNAPAWSADSKTIYYRRDDSSRVEHVIIARDLAGGGERELVRRKNVLGFSPSPDGKSLAYGVQDGVSKTKALLVMPIAGGEARELVRLHLPEVLGMAFEWSRDSQYVIYRKSLSEGGDSGASNPNGNLWRISAQGGQAVQLDLKEALPDFIAFHPDGKTVVYEGGVRGDEVWAMENFLPSLRAHR